MTYLFLLTTASTNVSAKIVCLSSPNCLRSNPPPPPYFLLTCIPHPPRCYLYQMLTILDSRCRSYPRQTFRSYIYPRPSLRLFQSLFHQRPKFHRALRQPPGHRLAVPPFQASPSRQRQQDRVASRVPDDGGPADRL